MCDGRQGKLYFAGTVEWNNVLNISVADSPDMFQHVLETLAKGHILTKSRRDYHRLLLYASARNYYGSLCGGHYCLYQGDALWVNMRYSPEKQTIFTLSSATDD